MGVVARTHPELKLTKLKTADSFLKRKLYFEEEESSTDFMMEVQQEGYGTPFTYYTHSNAYMDGAETPEVILVAIMCTEGAISKSQITVNPTNYCPNTLEYIKRKFMGKADKLFKVYITLHMKDHWDLMIIDFFNWKLVYLDSLKDSKVTKAHKDQMLYVNVGHPVDDTIPSVDNYDLPVVNEHTRMRLAIDIVLGRHNPIRAKIGRKAVEVWDKRCRRLARKTKKKTGQVDVTTSPTI
ncbi:hypothetical protein AHAS_Ahas19G0214100 [Arachis hypogaea]